VTAHHDDRRVVIPSRLGERLPGDFGRPGDHRLT
jgi:hypothetical protein